MVGRLDFDDEKRRPIYVGPVTVMDGVRVAVVDFTRDIARGYYRATEDDPMGLARKRTFDVNGRVLIDISDEVFAALSEKAAEDGTSAEPTRTYSTVWRPSSSRRVSRTCARSSPLSSLTSTG